EQKIIEHERMKEEGRHEDEIPLPGTVVIAEEPVDLEETEDASSTEAHDDAAADAHDDADHLDDGSDRSDNTDDGHDEEAQ
ncbi:MAG: hypothetical protein ACKOAX_09580, partial [Candidatus Kapaibacterium sp.]